MLSLCTRCEKHNTSTARSQLCRACFHDRCCEAGGLSKGNTQADKKKRNAGRQSSGNARTGKSKKDAGARSSGNTYTGARKKLAGARSSGNAMTGDTKKVAGRRSALKRSANNVLIIKNPWLDMILDGCKHWEIRSTSTRKRGWIHLALSGSGGMLLGRAQLVGCRRLSRFDFYDHRDKHCLQKMCYKYPCAWILSKAQRYRTPLRYDHPRGAIVWVKLGSSP
jgi:hypothetical protein